jgi:hypothetical protein
MLWIKTAKASDPPVEEGKSIFLSRCAGCHNVNKILTGPALAGVDERRSLDWIISFVHSSQTMVKKGDKDAVALFEKFKIPMPDHPDLTNDNIRSIVAYIKSETKAVNPLKTPISKPSIKKTNYFPFSFAYNLWPSIGLLAALSLLLLTLLFAAKVNIMKRKMAEKKMLK